MQFFLRDETDARLRAFGARSSKPLCIAAVISYCFMLGMQLYSFFTFHGEPTSDAWRYVTDALRCARAGVFYPQAADLVGKGTAGTGYVNLLILLFRVTENVRAAYILNILLVQLLLFSVLYLAFRATESRDVCAWTAIFFCLSATYWSEVCIARTEICFTALAFFGLALLFSERGGLPFLTGFILASANWIRPLGTAFMAAAVWTLIYRKSKWHGYLRLAAGFGAAVLLICCFTAHNCGEYLYQPTISSGNMLMGANEDADGSYDDTVFTEGKAGYIQPEIKKDMRYTEINAHYSEAASKWIHENPTRYIRLMPRKLFYMYISDTYSGDVYFDNLKQTSGSEYIREVVSMLRGEGRSFTSGDIFICWGQGFYMLTFALFLWGVIRSMRKGYWRSLSFLYGIFLIGTAMTVITVGGGRYHFPYLPILFITAAACVQSVKYSLTEKRKKQHENH